MRRHSPAAERNRESILSVLREVLPQSGLVLEIAAGTGQHAAYFAHHLPGLVWQPSDADPGALQSIAAWREEDGPRNLRAPLRLDVTERAWPVRAADALLCCNLLHIAPWAVCPALFRGAASILPTGAPVVLYGPFIRADAPTAPSNQAFDAQLRGRNAAWGIRALADVAAAAGEAGFAHEQTRDMPANNLIAVFRREAPA